MDTNQKIPDLSSGWSSKEKAWLEQLHRHSLKRNLSLQELVKGAGAPKRVKPAVEKFESIFHTKAIEAVFEIVCRTYNDHNALRKILEKAHIDADELKGNSKPLNIFLQRTAGIKAAYASKIVSAIKLCLQRKVALGGCSKFIKEHGGINACAKTYRKEFAKRDESDKRTQPRKPRASLDRVKDNWSKLRDMALRKNAPVSIRMRGTIDAEGLISVTSLERSQPVRSATPVNGTAPPAPDEHLWGD